MTNRDAHNLLDRVRGGERAPASVIRDALCATGDLDPIRIFRRVGTWERTREYGEFLLPAQPFDGLAS